MTFVTADGLMLEGRRFGTGTDFVVLGHMLPASMESWFDFARRLAEDGYSAIAFNFRGYGQSDGDGFAVDIDTVAAIDHALDLGAGQVFVIGASMGGTGAVAAGAARQVAGVVTLSAPARFRGVDAVAAASSLTAPALLIAARNDGPYPGDAEAIRTAGDGIDVLVLDGAQHGTNLFRDHGETLTRVLFEFVAGAGS